MADLGLQVYGVHSRSTYADCVDRSSEAACGNFDIILDHFSRISQLHITPHAPRATHYVVRMLNRVPIGGWNPMLWPIWGSFGDSGAALWTRD